ncbi:protein transport protein SEC24 [Drosophila eugracilis]|uniref:protein transport protein SEC24 n=1 Tax=Drosophila eugracilis TaxID=29029 RepID=UPI0007E7AA74|nr:protein transport protein SEC24 [Drosophila eugracilis]
MPSLWLFISMLALVSCQDYQYHRPQTPFVAETYRQQPQQQQQPHTTKFVVQTLGRTYGLETQRAPTIYEDHQTQIVQVLEPRQVTQYQQYAYQAPQQQLQTSSYQNPLLVSTNYQAPPLSYAPPAPAAPAQPINYYVPPQQQQQQSLPQPQQLQPAPAQTPNYYQQQPAAQPPATYLPPQQPAQKLFFGNPYPYAPVTTGSGQQVLDAGHGSGVAPNEVQTQLLQATGSSPPEVRVGDQVGQSQSSSLDGFDYKQSSPGDTREYQKFVTSCPGGGNCQKKELSPGEVDESHKRVLQTVRASTQPRVEGCFKSPVIYVPVGAAVNEQGQLRPKNRRTFERKEQVLSRYPYN